MYSEYLVLLVILALSIIGHNSTVAYAVLIVLVLKLLSLTTALNILSANGLNWGIVLLMVAILIPVATGEVTMTNMIDAFKSPLGIIAIICGVLAAMAGGGGVELLKDDPHIVAALIIGTIIGVCFFKGVAVGPLIAGGLTYALMKLFALVK